MHETLYSNRTEFPKIFELKSRIASVGNLL